VMPVAIPSLVARGPVWQQEQNIEQRMKEGGDKEKDTWHARALQQGTDMSSYQQQCKYHVVQNALIQDHTQSSPYTTCIFSLSPCSSHFPHLLPLLSANWDQSIYSQVTLLATHQAFLAEDLQITHIRLANNKPRDNITPHCTCSVLPLLTVPRSGLIRKDLE